MLAEQTRLIEENHNLIYGFLHKYKLSEDFYGDAAIGLCKAAMSYDNSNGTSFATYAYKCMFNECGITIRTEKRRVQTISFETPIANGENVNLESMLPSDFTNEHMESIPFIQWFIDKMGLLDLKILLYRLQGESFRDIASKVGFSYQHIKNRVSKFADSYNSRKQLKSQKETDNVSDCQAVKSMILAFVCN